MGFGNAVKGMGKGGLIGAGIGALGGMMTMGPFGLIPGAIMGATYGAGIGGTVGLFRPDYDQIQQVANPQMCGYGNNTQYYGGYAMPNTLYGNPPMTSTVPVSGYGGAALAGLAAGSLMTMGMGCWGYPMWGLGWPMLGLGMLPMMGMGLGMGWGWGGMAWGGLGGWW